MRTGLLVLLCFAVCACGDDEPSAPIPPKGGNPHIDDGTRPDGGQNVDDDDAGSKSDAGMDDGPRPGECRRIEAVQSTTDEMPTVTSTESPRDFLVTRTLGTWRNDCQTLAVELSDGACPNGNGHELEIEFAASAFTEGQIAFGLNYIEPETMAVPAIRVRYTRPTRFAPAGTYGTCNGASGTMTFYDAPDITRAMNLRANYELKLTPCDGKGNPTQTVAGYFDIRIVRTVSSACP